MGIGDVFRSIDGQPRFPGPPPIPGPVHQQKEDANHKPAVDENDIEFEPQDRVDLIRSSRRQCDLMSGKPVWLSPTTFALLMKVKQPKQVMAYLLVSRLRPEYLIRLGGLDEGNDESKIEVYTPDKNKLFTLTVCGMHLPVVAMSTVKGECRTSVELRNASSLERALLELAVKGGVVECLTEFEVKT